MGKEKLQTFHGAIFKKYLLRTLLAILVVFVICFSNGCWYLAKGQYSTVEKIDRGEKLSIYEKCTIYTLHMGLYIVGWVYAPQAAWANMQMAIPHSSDTIYYKTDCILTPKIKKRVKAERLGRMYWDGDKDYAFSSPERKAAILLNWCTLKEEVIDGVECVTATIRYSWKGIKSKTRFQITKGFAIVLHEQLFYEIEKCGWLHPYVLVAYTEKSKFLN